MMKLWYGKRRVVNAIPRWLIPLGAKQNCTLNEMCILWSFNSTVFIFALFLLTFRTVVIHSFSCWNTNQFKVSLATPLLRVPQHGR